MLARDREKGDYRFFDEVPTSFNTFVIALNLTHRDPVKREIFQNRDFRVGLSYAINRQEIINAVYQRQGEPYQARPRPDSPYYDEELAKQYTEFDVARANEHLDRAGSASATATASGCGRTGSASPSRSSPAGRSTSRCRRVWTSSGLLAPVGIDMRVNPGARALFEERRPANQHDATVWDSEGGGLIEPILRTDWYFPSGVESINYAPLWLRWYQTQGGSGEEPPAPVREQMELYDDLKATNDQSRRDEMMKRILQISEGVLLPHRNEPHRAYVRRCQEHLAQRPGEHAVLVHLQHSRLRQSPAVVLQRMTPSAETECQRRGQG